MQGRNEAIANWELAATALFEGHIMDGKNMCQLRLHFLPSIFLPFSPQASEIPGHVPRNPSDQAAPPGAAVSDAVRPNGEDHPPAVR